MSLEKSSREGFPRALLELEKAEKSFERRLIVTPLGAWSTVAGAWPFGVTLCDIWISVDSLGPGPNDISRLYAGMTGLVGSVEIYPD
ncbi:hypothetical protein OSTOST_12219, partial [Ostertagia ostertagi]